LAGMEVVPDSIAIRTTKAVCSLASLRRKLEVSASRSATAWARGLPAVVSLRCSPPPHRRTYAALRMRRNAQPDTPRCFRALFVKYVYVYLRGEAEGRAVCADSGVSSPECSACLRAKEEVKEKVAAAWHASMSGSVYIVTGSVLLRWSW
jgi:hypothetical protein